MKQKRLGQSYSALINEELLVCNLERETFYQMLDV